MDDRSPSFTVLAVVTLGCIFWITLICLGLVYLIGVSNETVWICAGLMGAFAIVVVLLVRSELKQALDLANCSDPTIFDHDPIPVFGSSAKPVKKVDQEVCGNSVARE